MRYHSGMMFDDRIEEDPSQDVGVFEPLRLRGGRHEKRGLTYASMQELINYEALFLESAKYRWLLDNPDRKRFPKGLEAKLRLTLTDVKNGSTIPLSAPTGPFDSVLEEIVNSTREAIYEFVESMSTSFVLPSGISPSLRASLRRLGASFKKDEFLTIGSPRDSAPVKYSHAIRTKVIANEDAKEKAVSGALVGQIREMNPDEQRFELLTPDGRRVPGKFQDLSRWEDLLKFLTPSAHPRIVRLTAKYVESLQGELIRISDVTDVQEFLYSDRPWTPRLLELLSLKTGWFEGAGRPIEVASVEIAQAIVSKVNLAASPFPAIFPTPSGGIQLELLDRTRHLEVTITENLEIEGYFLDASSGADLFETFTQPREASVFFQRWSSTGV